MNSGGMRQKIADALRGVDASAREYNLKQSRQNRARQEAELRKSMHTQFGSSNANNLEGIASRIAATVDPDRYDQILKELSTAKQTGSMDDMRVVNNLIETAVQDTRPGVVSSLQQRMGGTGAADRAAQVGVYGGGMSAGAAGLIAIMEALQGAMDNQERRDAPLQ